MIFFISEYLEIKRARSVVLIVLISMWLNISFYTCLRAYWRSIGLYIRTTNLWHLHDLFRGAKDLVSSRTESYNKESTIEDNVKVKISSKLKITSSTIGWWAAKKHAGSITSPGCSSTALFVTIIIYLRLLYVLESFELMRNIGVGFSLQPLKHFGHNLILTI